MITNRRLIEDALYALGALSEGESVSVDNGALCLRLLNEMLAAWVEDDIDLQYFDQTDIDAECPLPSWAVQGVKAALAVYVAADFGAPASPSLVARAEGGYQTIVNHAVKSRMRPADLSHLPQGSAGYFDVMKG